MEILKISENDFMSFIDKKIDEKNEKAIKNTHSGL